MRNEQRPIRLSKHAERRLVSRNITEAEVEMAIRAGAWELQGLDSWVARVPSAGRIVKVAFVETVDEHGEPILLVKTVMD